jgi:hypothetical protein
MKIMLIIAKASINKMNGKMNGSAGFSEHCPLSQFLFEKAF